MITIIDYGMGNLGSIRNMLKYIGINSCFAKDEKTIAKAEKLILPGVGAFDNGMTKLEQMNLIEILSKKVLEESTPILGICLGMHLFTKRSEEGLEPGLGWIDAEVKRFDFTKFPEKIRIPHMGWNTISIKKKSNLYEGLQESPRFYFVHSYYVHCNNESDILSITNYGFEFVSSFERDNIFGVQFHPEKSHKFGMKILYNFDRLV